MVAGLSLLRRVPRLVCSGILLLGVAAGNWINPFYPFPYENNLAFSDFVRLHVEADAFLEQRFPGTRVGSVWPLTAEIRHPELGYVQRAFEIERLPDFSAATVAAIDWKRVDVLVVYSRHWDPEVNILHWAPIERLWRHFSRSVPDVNSTEAMYLVPYPNCAHFERRGQWVDIYANPAVNGVLAERMVAGR